MSDLLLIGDLCQMSEQKRFLLRRGIPLGQTDVYPTVTEEYKNRSLLAIYTHKVDGWWNYENDYIEIGICTKEEFWKKFRSGS